MTNENELACPVCRAKQAYQTECRRCGADLTLLIKALRSAQAAQRQLEQSLRAGYANSEVALKYLRWLSPSRAQAVLNRRVSSDKA